MRQPAGDRPFTTGPETGPEPPYPIPLSGPVISGFGRGSKELGIPTANLDSTGLPEGFESGIYYGWAGLDLPESKCGVEGAKAGTVLPMVMSYGWNPFYKNEVRSVEVHIIHSFPQDFYGVHMNILILGYIRPEFDYVDKEALIDDIKKDISVAATSLERPAYEEFKSDERLLMFPVKEGKAVI